MTYTELQEQIVSWIQTSQITLERSREMIVLAEAEMNRFLETSPVQWMSYRVNRATVVDREFYPLPEDWAGGRTFRIQGPERWYDLEYYTPEQIENIAQPPGFPYAYTIVACEFRIAPSPEAVYPLQIVYYRRLRALSDEYPTNWMLNRSPDAYLWGALKQAESFLRNDERIPVWREKFFGAMTGLREADQGSRWSHGTTRTRSA